MLTAQPQPLNPIKLGIPQYLLPEEDCPLQVLTFTLTEEQKTITHVNATNLRKVLLRQDIRDLPVVVLSVAGKISNSPHRLLIF